MRVEVDQAVLRYPEMRLEFTLEVASGECLALIGPSGAGKSTLLALIAGFERAVSGRVLMDGEDVSRLAAAERPVTTVFQEHNLFAHLCAADNVGLGIHPGLRLRREDRGRVAEALAQVGLAGLERRLPGALSGGQRQRVALARALVRDKPVLLLDEPFAALGPALRREMLTLVDSLRRSTGVTTLLVSHHPQDALLAADRAAFINSGVVVAVDETASLLRRREHPALAAYLGDTAL